jgi:hypothetical protein
VPAPISDDKRQRIIQLCEAGNSARSIATDVNVSVSTVSNVAKSIGHRFGRSNLAHAQEARSAYSAERRAGIAARLTEETERLLDELHGEYLVFNFGGRDNTYEEHTLSEPPTEAKRALMQTIRDAMRTVLDIDRHDNKGDGNLSAVDEWLAEKFGV